MRTFYILWLTDRKNSIVMPKINSRQTVSLLLMSFFVTSIVADVVTRLVTYEHDGDQLIGYLAYDSAIANKKSPAVLVVPDWNGRDEYENGRARQLAELGYVAFAVDVYGNGTVGNSPAENRQLMSPWLSNRQRFVRRLQAALGQVKSFWNVDTSKIAAQGYCLGGMGVLDMARSGIDLKGVVSFHGMLSPPSGGARNPPITAKILVQTGYNDPSVDPEKVKAFEAEMKQRNAPDWQLISYGNTFHAFTVPTANTPGRSHYSAVADMRSFALTKAFYEEIFS